MLPSNLINQLGNTLEDYTPSVLPSMTGDRVMISARVPKELKDTWFELCQSHGLSFSTGIIVAFDVLQECIKRNLVELKPYGAVFNAELQ